MCAILDANVTSEVFGDTRTPAGQKFREWLDRGRSSLVMGGKLADELTHDGRFRAWSETAIQYGRLQLVDSTKVDERAAELHSANACVSDDEHVIALAQLSGARLLFSNEPNLHTDFKSKILIDEPRGKVFSTKDGKQFTTAQRRLLADKVLCRRP